MNRELMEALQGTVLPIWRRDGKPSAGLALGFSSATGAYAAARAGVIPTIPLGKNKMASPCAKLRKMLAIEDGSKTEAA